MAKYHYKYRRPQRRRLPFKKILWCLAALMLLAYPFWEATTLTVEEHTLYVTDLPANLKNLKIVFASDIHQCAWFSQSRVNELIGTINGLNADIIILGGDYATDSDSAIAFFRTAPALHARLGVFGVLGNHDRTQPESNLGLLMAEMKNYGCLPLVNTVSRMKLGQTYIYVAGVDDYYNGFSGCGGRGLAGQQRRFRHFCRPHAGPDARRA